MLDLQHNVIIKFSKSPGLGTGKPVPSVGVVVTAFIKTFSWKAGMTNVVKHDFYLEKMLTGSIHAIKYIIFRENPNTWKSP